MSIALKIFDIHPEEITLSDLKDFFSTPQEETSILEFKSGEVQLEGIYEEVSAFLNTEGGLIIIGAPKEFKEKNKKIAQGDLTYSKFKSKHWLHQKIASNITPPPNRLEIYEIPNGEGNLFLIDVPQSKNPPHQCHDGRYLIRFGEESRAAPHGIVQALFQNRALPILDADIDIDQIDNYTDKIVVSIKNTSTIPADRIGIIIQAYNVNAIGGENKFEKAKDIHLGENYFRNFSPSGVLVQVVSFPIEFLVQHFKKEYVIAASYWSSTTDFDLRFWTYNPLDRKIVLTDKFRYEKHSLIDELRRINNPGFSRKENI